MPERLVERFDTSSHAQERDMKTMSGSSVMAGIDVASTHVDVVCPGATLTAELTHISNDPEGHVVLADALAKLQPDGGHGWL